MTPIAQLTCGSVVAGLSKTKLSRLLLFLCTLLSGSKFTYNTHLLIHSLLLLNVVVCVRNVPCTPAGRLPKTLRVNLIGTLIPTPNMHRFTLVIRIQSPETRIQNKNPAHRVDKSRDAIKHFSIPSCAGR